MNEKKKGVTREKYRLTDENGKPTPFIEERITCDDPASPEGIEALKEMIHAASPQGRAEKWQKRAMALIPPATRGWENIKDTSSGGKYSHGLTPEEREARNQEILKQFERVKSKGKSEKSTYRILGKRFELHEDTIRKIVKAHHTK